MTEKNPQRKVGIRPDEALARKRGMTSMGDFVIQKVNTWKASVTESDMRKVALMLVAEQPELKAHLWEGDHGRSFFSYPLQRLTLDRYIKNMESDPKHAKFERRILALKSVLASLPEADI